METNEKNVVYALFNNDVEVMHYYNKDGHKPCLANITLADATLFNTLKAAENTKSRLNKDGYIFNVIKISYAINVVNNSYCIVFSDAGGKMKYLKWMDEDSITCTTLENAMVFESIDSANEYIECYGHNNYSRFEIIKLD